ncbi:nitrogen fixation protein NifQ [Alteromonadaceae bacterium Bs31]|nr:nitrogen fixation protein NifQ [Alteromonadaceae bacterium Bs31]
MPIGSSAALDLHWDSTPNQRCLSIILLAQRSGLGCLPKLLGLNAKEFGQLLHSRFRSLKGLIDTAAESKQSLIRQELLDLRRDEWLDLVKLLEQYRRGEDVSEQWLTKIIAAACLGSDHLWRDLGLPDRLSLGELMKDNFPDLAKKNSGDMRWKKFLYRQLCELGGHFVCRSPSCETCPTYDECFGEEV